MNKIIMRVVTVASVILLLSGCNKKKSHFQDGGDLVCTNSSLFGKDVTRTINTNNATYSSLPSPRNAKEGFYYGDSFLNTLNTFFDIDNCEIK